MTIGSAIFRGKVTHERLRPKHHRLSYSVFTMLFDLDDLADLDRQGALFGYNRRGDYIRTGHPGDRDQLDHQGRTAL